MAQPDGRVVGRSQTDEVGEKSTTTTLTGELHLASIAGRAGTAKRSIVADEYTEQVVAMLSFNDSPDLCRAVRLATVTRNCAQLWSSSQGSEATYKLSRTVPTIQTFISHNWVVGRFRKWCALSFYFNFRLAAVTSLVVASTLTLLGLLGVIPVFISDSDTTPAVYANLATCPVFFLMLFFGRNIAAYLGVPSPDVFLDKVCIHQVDHAIQKKGILKLGAFLGVSEEMLILYTNIYLLKLWTVYEVAAFTLQHQDAAKRMKVVPVYLVDMVLVAIVLNYFGCIFWGISKSFSTSTLPSVIFILAYFLVYIFATRIWQRDKAQIRERIFNFKVRDCICAVESDRAIVYSNIAALTRAFGLIEANSNSDEALDAFDVFVRDELQDAFASAVGRCSFEYYHYMFIGIVASGVLFFDYIATLPHTSDPKTQIGGAAVALFWTFAVWPLGLSLQEYFLSYNLHLTGCKEFAYVLTVILVFSITGILCSSFTDAIEEMAGESNVALAVLIALAITSVVIGSILLCRRPSAADRTSGALKAKHTLQTPKEAVQRDDKPPIPSKLESVETEHTCHEEEEDALFCSIPFCSI